MLRARITHPHVLAALASAGHKSTILVTDANFAAATTTGPNAEIVFLNLEPGSPSITRVVELLASMVPIEARVSMELPDGAADDSLRQIDDLFGRDVASRSVSREKFYSLARSKDLALCIVTGDTHRFANVILTVGVNTQSF